MAKTLGSKPAAGDTSRMTGDSHVRICEGLGVKFPRAARRGKFGVGFGGWYRTRQELLPVFNRHGFFHGYEILMRNDHI